jgi:amino acid transporter
VLKRWDLVLFSVAAVVGLDSGAQMASWDLGQGLVWIFVFVILFMLPYGMLTAELGAAFPAEGGIYSWVRLAYGKLPGELTAIFYWFANTTWIGATLAGATVLVINTFYLSKPLGPWPSLIIGLAFVWVSVLLSVISLKYGKWAGNVGAWVKALAVVMFVVLVCAYLVKYGVVRGAADAHSYIPSVSGFLAIAPAVVFVYVGFELASGASEEMTNPRRDVPAGILRSGIASAVLYAAVAACILLVLPVSKLQAVSGFDSAFATVNTELFGGGEAAKVLGYFFGLIVILALVASASVWTMGTCRVAAVAALDGAAPRFLGRFGTRGTPVVMAIMTGVVASAPVITLLGIYRGGIDTFFSTMLSLTLAATMFALLFIIPAVATLRHKYPDLQRPYTIPGGKLGLWVCVVLGEGCVIMTVITMLWPGLLNNLFGRSYSMQDDYGVGRGYFEAVTLGYLVVLVLIGVGLWLWGRAETGAAEPPHDALIEGVIEGVWSSSSRLG